MIDNSEDLKDKALACKQGLKSKFITIPIGDEKYDFKISGIGPKAIRLEKYIKYDEIIEAISNGNDNGLESVIKKLIEDYEEYEE